MEARRDILHTNQWRVRITEDTGHMVYQSIELSGDGSFSHRTLVPRRSNADPIQFISVEGKLSQVDLTRVQTLLGGAAIGTMNPLVRSISSDVPGVRVTINVLEQHYQIHREDGMPEEIAKLKNLLVECIRRSNAGSAP